jgi:hypothetical protein
MFKYNNHKTGAINELKSQLYYMENDYDVFTPTHGKTRADFIAVKGNKVLRVQVKTAQYNMGYIQSRLDIQDTRYTKEDCDIIFFIIEKRMWAIPIEEISGLSSICLGRVDTTKPYKPQKGYNCDKWEIK